MHRSKIRYDYNILIMVKVRDVIAGMRIKQWPKNGFMFAAIVFDGQLFHWQALSKTLTGFVLLCLLNSGIYYFNDLIDLPADRSHPKKKFRPIAAGLIPVNIARLISAGLLIVALVGAFLLNRTFFLVLFLILTLNIIYTLSLKHIPLIDVVTIGILFILRVLAGVVLIKVKVFSPWLYLVTFMLALYLGFGKRRTELIQIGNRAGETRPVLNGYSLPLLDQLVTIVSSVTIIAYSLYTFSGTTLPENHLMMLTIPIVVLGIFRYLYLIQVKHSGSAPEEILIGDRVILGTVAAFILFVLVILYF